MKNIENLFDKDLGCTYKYIRYFVLFYPAENGFFPGHRVIVKCNITTGDTIVAYTETPEAKAGERKRRTFVQKEGFDSCCNVFSTYGAAKNYIPENYKHEVSAEKSTLLAPDLGCPLDVVRYVVAFYGDGGMVTHQKRIVKFDMTSGNGVIVRDDIFPEYEGTKLNIYVGDDVDQLDNVFDTLTKAEKYDFRGESVCPESGEFTAYKVGVRKNGTPVLVKLRVLEEAKRISVFMKRICRCDCAEVLSIMELDSGKKYKKCRSLYNKKFKYKLGEIVHPDGFCTDRREWYGAGISFFMTENEARDYYRKGGAVPW